MDYPKYLIHELEQEHREIPYVESINTPECIKIAKQQLDELCEFAASKLYKEKPRKIIGIVSRYIGSSSGFRAPYCLVTPKQYAQKFDYIVINDNAICSLFQLFNVLLSHPSVLKHIGSSNQEDPLRSTKAKIFLTENSAQNAFCIPLNKDRAIAAKILFGIALDYIVFHELSHLKNGHVDYSEVQPSISQITKHTLEMDADSGAILGSLNKLCERTDDIAESRLPCRFDRTHRNIMRSRRHCIGYVLLVAYCIFRFLGFSVKTKSENPRHPDFMTRAHWTYKIMLAILEKYPNYNYPAREFMNEFPDVILDAEEALCAVWNVTLEPVKKFLDDLEKDTEFSIALDTEWKRIRPELEQYKRGGNLAA